ncbi:hypothetical protein AX14_003190 [Amanita brunnescens Koide BX004]|nr:hypothetical protein AX14_003190 [Amanita brunnescens Koide BX004]
MLSPQSRGGLQLPLFPPPPQVPHGLLPSNAAVQPAVRLYNNNDQITDLSAGLRVPTLSDPWHRAHARVCAHASAPCAACSVALFCCTCHALRFTPGPPPASPSALGIVPPAPSPAPPRRSRSSSLVLFRDVRNGTPPPGFNSHCDDYNDEAYAAALAEAHTCDNSSCPRGAAEPATYSITVEQFDEGSEEVYDRILRACSACNRSCKKSFMGHRIKSRTFDNSAREALADRTASKPVFGQPLGADTPPTRCASPSTPVNASLNVISVLQDSLRELNKRPPTPIAFVASARVRHDARCTHQVDNCPTCSNGLLCCSCNCLFKPAVARHLKCANCKHLAHTCCTTCFCCQCNKPWTPLDGSFPVREPSRGPAWRFFGGAGSNSSPEPDIWTPSPRSSPDEIDDLTARVALPLPVSRSESDASRAPSRASSVDEPVNVAATPLPTPDYSSLKDEAVDGFVHDSFPDRAILDNADKRHFLGRGDLSVTSLKLYARRIFTDTSHWITAGHFLLDIFGGSTLKGSRDDFRRFVILVGTQLGYGDLAQSMSESLDVNRKMADEYMRLRDVATTWKQKAKSNSKDARDGRKAHDELQKARGDITSILEEREVFITQRNKLLDDIKRLNVELSRVHRDYDQAIKDNTDFASNVETLEQDLNSLKRQLSHSNNSLSMAEHQRNKAELDLDRAVQNLDIAIADKARDKAFYEARITALSSLPIPTSQPDTEAPIKASDAERAVLLSRIENLKKELSVRDVELATLRAEVSQSSDVNTLRSELAEAKAVSARLSGMYEQKSKDFRELELERLSLLGKQILADGKAQGANADSGSRKPRPASRRGRQRSRSGDRPSTPAPFAPPAVESVPSSQPFWQDEPLFTKHVAAVTTATMSALPHLPFETAIASAFTTVRNVGPPPPLKLDKKPIHGRTTLLHHHPLPISTLPLCFPCTLSDLLVSTPCTVSRPLGPALGSSQRRWGANAPLSPHHPLWTTQD